MIVAQQTAWLSAEHRAQVDQTLGPRLERLGDRQTETEAKRLAYRLDPHGYLARQAKADADRRVTTGHEGRSWPTPSWSASPARCRSPPFRSRSSS